MILGTFPTNILGVDLLKGWTWTDLKVKEWVFGLLTVSMRLLQPAPELPPSKTVNVKPYPLPLGAQEGVSSVIWVPTHSP